MSLYFEYYGTLNASEPWTTLAKLPIDTCPTQRKQAVYESGAANGPIELRGHVLIMVEINGDINAIPYPDWDNVGNGMFKVNLTWVI